MATTMFRSACRVLSFGGRISSLNAPRFTPAIPRRWYAAANIPTDLKYTDQHEWIRLEGDIATLGITNHAQDQLGEVVFCELPEVGALADKAGVLCVIESVKAVSDIYAPLAGEVTEVNTKLEDAPEKINEEPYGKGWLVKLKISDQSELSELMDAEAYTKLTEES
ncbi:glycine cleavage system H protein-like [Lineus longissimus]|uniref:glycine cleavage system H protein-like n=1 Tax=Lineus longissimus TaxID=88925 RepID=UPI002B4E8651